MSLSAEVGAGERPVPKILFATIAAGGGHVATANAMAEALHALAPRAVSTQVSDVMADFGFEELDRRHKESWRAMLKRPRLVRLGQRVTDTVPSLTRAAQNALLDDFAKAAQRRIDEMAPDLVVANHGWLATALTLARRKYGMVSRVLIFATEPFDASALWAEPRADGVVAPSAAAKEDLVRLGVPRERVVVLGYPVRQEFLAPTAQAAARRSLGLSDEFTCLLSLGAEGLAGEALCLAETLARMDLQVVAIAGRNAELFSGFEALAGRYPRLRAVGFTNEMPAHLAAADLVIGKAGPASTMEALAVGRPVLATSYAGLNERWVVRFLQTRGLGSYAPTLAMLPGEVAAWRQPGRLESAARAAQELDFAGMSERLARFLLLAARSESESRAGWPTDAVGAFESVTAPSLAGRPLAKKRTA